MAKQQVAVKDAKQATELALSFVKKHRVIARPLKAALEGDTWLVTMDVGAILVEVATLKIDAKTGDILEYEFPESS